MAEKSGFQVRLPRPYISTWRDQGAAYVGLCVCLCAAGSPARKAERLSSPHGKRLHFVAFVSPSCSSYPASSLGATGGKLAEFHTAMSACASVCRVSTSTRCSLTSCKHAVAQVASGSGDAKFLRQNQEWPKKVVFRRACRTHTLALSMIRAHTWLKCESKPP